MIENKSTQIEPVSFSSSTTQTEFEMVDKIEKEKEFD